MIRLCLCHVRYRRFLTKNRRLACVKVNEIQLILDALEQSLWARGKPKGVVHHSDRTRMITL